MEEEALLKHLFQQEFSKMVAVISSLFGLQHIETAEDIVSETFLQATETWGVKGVPKNPAAWLYAVAKQKTLSHFRWSKIFETKVIPELVLRQEKEAEPGELDFSTQNIRDSQLQMLLRSARRPSPARPRSGWPCASSAGSGSTRSPKRFCPIRKRSINACSGQKRNYGPKD